MEKMPESADEPMKDEAAEYSEYELKDKARILQEAAEIQADPGLMKLLKPLLEKKVKAIRSLADLKALAQEKAMMDTEEPESDMGEESGES